MATWAQFEQLAPESAAVAARLWPGAVALQGDALAPAAGPWFSVAYLATVRADGAPRLHPFCPIIAMGRLFAAIPLRSPKGRDLRRDPRCVIMRCRDPKTTSYAFVRTHARFAMPPHGRVYAVLSNEVESEG